MPPKKKPRIPSRGASTPTTSADTPHPPKVSGPSQPDESSKRAQAVDENFLLTDPWTDEQETALFKGIVRFKPVGMHKHFRMIALHEYIHSAGCTSKQDQHTRISGIWEKLHSLYNLSFLDEREDAFLPSPPPDDSNGSALLYHPFSLPQDDFGEEMYDRRFAPSPSIAAASDNRSETHDSHSRLASTIEDTDELASSPAGGRSGRRFGRSAKTAAGGRNTRTSRLQTKIDVDTTAEDEGDGDEDMVMVDAGVDEEEAEENADEEEGTESTDTKDGHEDEEEEDKSAPKKGAGRGRSRGGTVRGGPRRGKGRGR